MSNSDLFSRPVKSSLKSIYLDDLTAARRVASRIDKYSDVDEMLYDMNRASPPMARAAKQAMTYAKDKVRDWKYSLDRDAIDFARRVRMLFHPCSALQAFLSRVTA